jgi:hypothetical protein
VEIKDRFVLIGPAKTMLDLTMLLNAMPGGINKVVAIQRTLFVGYFALLDRNPQLVLTTEDLEDIPSPEHEETVLYKVGMA